MTTVQESKVCETCSQPFQRKRAEGRAAFNRRRTCSWTCRLARVPKECTVDGCPKKPTVQGLCGGHYQRLKRTGQAGSLLRDDDPARAARLFWGKVDKEASDRGCWLWTSETNNHGYGVHRIWVSGRRHGTKVLAHRHAYVDATSEDIAGRVLLHSCDNPPCVNPAHLRPGTQAQNIEDARAKGRMVAPPRFRGSSHPASRLSEPDVREILRLLSSGMTQVAIGERFGVSASLVSHIKRGITWKHVARDFDNEEA